ncbi:hypothetical protein MRX96_048804 [Rhipicephalus microplus]
MEAWCSRKVLRRHLARKSSAITSLVNPNTGSLVETQDEVLEVARQFYKNLYAEPPPTPYSFPFTKTYEDFDICDTPLVEEEEKRKRPQPTPRALLASGCVEVVNVEQEVEDGATASPTNEHYKELLHASTEKVTQLQKKVEVLQQNKRRLSRRNEVAEEIMKKLKEQNLLSEEGTEVGEQSQHSDDLNVAAPNRRVPGDVDSFSDDSITFGAAADTSSRSNISSASLSDDEDDKSADVPTSQAAPAPSAHSCENHGSQL